jgi:hypothetical protein
MTLHVVGDITGLAEGTMESTGVGDVEVTHTRSHVEVGQTRHTHALPCTSTDTNALRLSSIHVYPTRDALETRTETPYIPDHLIPHD